MNSTIGRVLINSGIPEEFRDYTSVFDGKKVKSILEKVAEKYPDRYSAVLQHFMDVGREISSSSGLSVDLKSLLPYRSKAKLISQLKFLNQKDIDNDELTDEERDKRIIRRTGKYVDKIKDAVMEEAKENRSPYALQVLSGGRGNPYQHNSLVGADLLVSDSNGDPVPVPIYNSYSDGLDPVEYWASTYGARSGLKDVKLGTAAAGFLSKQLNLATHRQVVTDEKPKKMRLPVGLVVDSDDPDNEGAVLAQDIGPYKAGQVISADILDDLGDLKDKILIHSPMTSLTEGGGLDRFSAGRRGRGEIAYIGDQVGLEASQAIGEPVAQGTLSSKHSSGVSSGGGVKKAGFDYLNRLLQAPAQFKEAGPVAPTTSRVGNIEEAPQGGKYINIGGERVYVHPGLEVTVKSGQKVEEGDNLTEGVPHPKDLIKHVGVGEARRRYMGYLREALQNSGISAKRRNIENIVAGLINNVQINAVDGVGDNLVGDVVPYNIMAASYRPREGTQRLKVDRAQGRYLEEPALHYSPGTKITDRVSRELKEFGIEDVDVHEESPEYDPYFERLETVTSLDPDWRTQMGGFYIGRSLQKSVNRAAESDAKSTSFIPALAEGKGFGKELSRRGLY